MRTANVVLVVVCLSGVVGAAWMAWRWRQRPLVPCPSQPDETVGQAFRAALRTFNAVVIGSWVSGLLVVGLGGRLFMRILGGLSPHAQGLETDAEQTVGRITLGGSFGFVLAAAVFTTALVITLYLVPRPWMPATAAPAGLVLGVFAVGTLVVSDPMDPDNPDFDILEPKWLGIIMLVAIALLAGTTWTAVAARVEAGLPELRWGRAVFAYLPLFASLIVLWITIVGVVYVVGRVAVRGRLGPALRSQPSRRIGGTVIGAITAWSVWPAVNAARDILTA